MKMGPFPYLTLHVDAAFTVFHNPVDYRKSQTGSPPNFLRGKIGLKYLVNNVRWNARAGVAHRHFEVTSGVQVAKPLQPIGFYG